MSLQTLDRTQWSYAEALAHVQNVMVARRAVEAAKLPPKPVPEYQMWNRPQDPMLAWKAEAETELLVALRDGDLLARGRFTEERTHGWGNGGSSSGFGLHSGYHSSIRPEQWREGKCSFGRLTARDWEFIDIRVARFLVKAIWPDYIPETVRPAQGAADVIYTTPYLELVQEPIGRGRAGIVEAGRCHGHADQATLRPARWGQTGNGPRFKAGWLKPVRLRQKICAYSA
jgi:hypothetical protein